jgi:hypothetical protein
MGPETRIDPARANSPEHSGVKGFCQRAAVSSTESDLPLAEKFRLAGDWHSTGFKNTGADHSSDSSQDP